MFKHISWVSPLRQDENQDALSWKGQTTGRVNTTERTATRSVLHRETSLRQASHHSHPFPTSLMMDHEDIEQQSDRLFAIPAWKKWIVQWDMSHNAIPLAFFAFTSMWQTASTHFGMVSIPRIIWFILYFTSCFIAFICIIIFLIRCYIFPGAIVSDFHHPRLFNFFFMPVIIGALCILTSPPFLRSVTQFRVAFYVLGVYQVTLALYLFGEWLFGAHPTNFIHPLVFMQTIGFFLLANIAATSHCFQQGLAMFIVGVLFWLLVFFTNFQHVSLALDKRRERPSPTFFLFIAPPAQAALAFVVLEVSRSVLQQQSSADPSTVAQLTGALLRVDEPREWPLVAQCFLYVDLFLYLLVFRLVPTFWTSKFSVSWWAYIFPLSAAATATFWRYKSESGTFWGVLACVLALIACIAMIVVLAFTLWSLFSQRTPRNDACLAAYQRYYAGIVVMPSLNAGDGLRENRGSPVESVNSQLERDASIDIDIHASFPSWSDYTKRIIISSVYSLTVHSCLYSM